MTAEEQKAADDKVVADAKKTQTVNTSTFATRAAGAQEEPLVLTGVRGGPFSVSGTGFGASGSLTVGGKSVTEITRWDNENVRGTLPKDAQGEVVLISANGNTRRGVYPQPPPALVVKTTTVETAPTK